MCFVRACWVGFFVNDIAPWLSHRITIASFISCTLFFHELCHPYGLLGSLRTCHVYRPRLLTKRLWVCHLLLQEMPPPPIMNTNLMVDLLSSTSPTQSASQYSTKSWGGDPPKCNLNFKMPYKYRKMRLTTIQ